MYRALEPNVPANSVSWKRLLLAVTVAFIYGLSDELHQGFVPGRTLDIKDIAADAVGGVLAAIVVYIYYSRKYRRQNSVS